MSCMNGLTHKQNSCYLGFGSSSVITLAHFSAPLRLLCIGFDLQMDAVEIERRPWNTDSCIHTRGELLVCPSEDSNATLPTWKRTAIVLVGLEQPEFPLPYPIKKRIWVFSGHGERRRKDQTAITQPMSPYNASLLSLGSPSILSPQFLFWESEVLWDL